MGKQETAEKSDGSAVAEETAEGGKTDLQDKIAEAMNAEAGQKSEVRSQKSEGGEPEEKTEDQDQDPDAEQPETQETEDPVLEDGKIKPGEVSGLSPQAQAKVNERIHELNVKRKEAQAEAETAAAKVKELEARDAEVMRDAIRIGLAPEYVSKEEVADLKRYEALRLEKRWLTRHREGYEGTGKEGDPILSAADVADREADIEDTLADLAPRAKALMRERMELMLGDMKTGRNIRLHSSGKSGKAPAPRTLPGGGKSGLKPPTPAGVKTGFTHEGFMKGGANKTALQKALEDSFSNY